MWPSSVSLPIWPPTGWQTHASVRRHLVTDKAPLPIDRIERIVLEFQMCSMWTGPCPNPSTKPALLPVCGLCHAARRCHHCPSLPQTPDRQATGERAAWPGDRLEHPQDNLPNFNTHCTVRWVLPSKDGPSSQKRSDTFYGHWRKPLSQKDLQEKFRANSCRTLSCHIERLIEIVENLEDLEDCSVLTTLLKETSPQIASKSIQHLTVPSYNLSYGLTTSKWLCIREIQFSALKNKMSWE